MEAYDNKLPIRGSLSQKILRIHSLKGNFSSLPCFTNVKYIIHHVRMIMIPIISKLNSLLKYLAKISTMADRKACGLHIRPIQTVGIRTGIIRTHPSACKQSKDHHTQVWHSINPTANDLFTPSFDIFYPGS